MPIKHFRQEQEYTRDECLKVYRPNISVKNLMTSTTFITPTNPHL